MPTLSRPKSEVFDLLAEVMGRYHLGLVETGVTVGLLSAWPNETEEHAVKLHGYPCAAVVKITPYVQRVQGIEDAVITLDGQTWSELDEAGRVALLDHELYHLEVARDKDGEVKSDDHGRPKLKMRLHDWQLGGFEAIAWRHKGAALEVQMFRAANTKFYQAVFAWSDDMAPAEDIRSKTIAEAMGPDVSVSVNGKPVETMGQLGAAVFGDPEPASWHNLGVPSLRVPGPVHGKLMDAGVKTLGQLGEKLASQPFDGALAELWGMEADTVHAVRAAFDAIANPSPEAERYGRVVEALRVEPEPEPKPKRSRKRAAAGEARANG